jgi:hypothetical protein
MIRRLASLLTAAILAGAVLMVVGYKNATAAPVVRHLFLVLPDYQTNAPPVRILLFSDAHVHGPDMPPSRLSRIVMQINSLHPDIIVAAGDFVGDSWIGEEYPISEAVAPLRRLKARFGVYAVLGNNDYDAGAKQLASALEAAGLRVLENDASSVGPLAIGGIEGRYHRSRAALASVRHRTYKALHRIAGAKLLVAHRPDEFEPASPWIHVVLAGHTHCGQIVLPLVGPLETGSDFGRKYMCGVHRDGSKVLIVTAGLGTSHLPLRIGAPADMWLITIGGPGSRPIGGQR